MLAYVRKQDELGVGPSFEARVLSSAEFRQESGGVEWFAHDEDERRDPDLIAALGLDELPAIAVLDSQKVVHARLDVTSATTVADVQRTLVAVQSNVDLAAMLRSLPAEEAAVHSGDLLVAEALVGKYDFDQLDKRMQALGERLTPEQREKLKPVHIELECAWLLQQRDLTPKQKSAHFWRLLRSSRLPAGKVRVRFWLEFAATGDAVDDPLMLETALEVLDSTREITDDFRRRLRTRIVELRKR